MRESASDGVTRFETDLPDWVPAARADAPAGGWVSATENRESVTGSPFTTGVDLYWLPLGAGGRFVRLNGRVFEAVVSRLEHRPACDLYHSALEVRVPDGRFVIEQTPVPDNNGIRRGVAVSGPVGARWVARFRVFRYEVRR